MNNVSVSQKGGKAELASALLFYTQQSPHSSNAEISLITQHKVKMIDNQPVIQEGKTLSQSSMRAMAKTMLKKKLSELRFIPENILAQDDTTTVWWIPSQVTTLHFKTRELDLKDRCGQVEIPSCIFADTEQGAFVLCFEGSNRPTAKTPLYFSPFLNVWDQHNICMGSTIQTKKGDVDAWTKAFFSSAFSHSNYRSAKAELKREGGREQLWRDMLDKKMEKFPFDCLPTANLTVEKFIEMIGK